MVAAILLAAGLSQRMGQAKVLLPWGGVPLVRHLAQIALAVPFDPVIVVTGFSADAVRSAVADLAVTAVHNTRYQDGQSTSVVRGIEAVSAEASGVAVLLGDQPLVQVELLRELVAAHEAWPEFVVVPTFEGQRGNPVVLPRAMLSQMTQLTGDQGARAWVRAQPERVKLVPVRSRAVIDDMDTPEEYRALLHRSQEAGPGVG
ncbi:MAG: nucleotidyltransferase family protein [Herpetosiphon sp.]